MDLLHNNITKFFEEKLSDLECEEETRSYIIGIYSKFKIDNDLSKNSITLLYADAKYSQDFVIFQKLGDYIFFSQTITPGYLKHASKEYYNTIAKLSYYSCYRLTNRKLNVYKNIGDNFEHLENQVKIKLHD